MLVMDDSTGMLVEGEGEVLVMGDSTCMLIEGEGESKDGECVAGKEEELWIGFEVGSEREKGRIDEG